ncbi:heme-binding protein [Angustibacter sp. McL0619]|uniref:heme-binding protein n=1 Tax=Angustibacter sp. McL0619 TaxID=3415676 RepID=UPI003CF5A6A1
MAQDSPSRAAELASRESQLVLDSFDNAAAWRLGEQMVARALREGAAVIIDVQRPGLVLFRSALAGATAENQAWLDRKARTVFRFEMSTALLAERFAAQGVDVWTAGWFDSQLYTNAGGSFPLRVRGVGVVAAVTVSGLTSDEDHDFIVASLQEYLDQGPSTSAE